MNLLGCPDRVVVEAVTQSMDDAHHMQAARGRQNDFEKNFAFNLETASLLGIDRGGLENDFRRCAGGGRSFSRVRPYGRRSGNVGIAKGRSLNRGLQSARMAIGNGSAIAKTGACNHASGTPCGASGSALP